MSFDTMLVIYNVVIVQNKKLAQVHPSDNIVNTER